jgi:hypothetical protein
MIKYKCFSFGNSVDTGSQLENLLNRYVAPDEWIVCGIQEVNGLAGVQFIIIAYKEMPDPDPAASPDYIRRDDHEVPTEDVFNNTPGIPLPIIPEKLKELKSWWNKPHDRPKGIREPETTNQPTGAESGSRSWRERAALDAAEEGLWVRNPEGGN